MALAFDGTPNTQSANGATSLTFSGLPTTAGDIQVACIYVQGANTSITKPSNFTQIDLKNDGGTTSTDGAIATFIGTAPLAANPQFSWTTSAHADGWAASFSGANGTVDAHSVKAYLGVAQGTLDNAPALTPTQTGEMFLAFFARNDNNTVTTAPSGEFAENPSGGVNAPDNTAALRTYYLANPGLVAAQPGLTWSNRGFTDQYAAYVVLQPTASAPPPPQGGPNVFLPQISLQAQGYGSTISTAYSISAAVSLPTIPGYVQTAALYYRPGFWDAAGFQLPFGWTMVGQTVPVNAFYKLATFVGVNTTESTPSIGFISAGRQISLEAVMQVAAWSGIDNTRPYVAHQEINTVLVGPASFTISTAPISTPSDSAALLMWAARAGSGSVSIPPSYISGPGISIAYAQFGPTPLIGISSIVQPLAIIGYNFTPTRISSPPQQPALMWTNAGGGTQNLFGAEMVLNPGDLSERAISMSESASIAVLGGLTVADVATASGVGTTIDSVQLAKTLRAADSAAISMASDQGLTLGAITLQGNYYNTGNGTAVAATLPGTAGNTQAIYILNNGGGSNQAITPPTNFALAATSNSGAGGGNTNVTVWVATQNLVAAPTFTLGTSSDWCIIATEWSGIGLLDAASASTYFSVAENTSTATTAPAIKTSVPNGMVLAFYANNDFVTPTGPNGYTEVGSGGPVSGNFSDSAAYYLINGKPGSQQPQINWNSSSVGKGGNAYVAFRPASPIAFGISWRIADTAVSFAVTDILTIARNISVVDLGVLELDQPTLIAQISIGSGGVYPLVDSAATVTETPVVTTRPYLVDVATQMADMAAIQTQKHPFISGPVVAGITLTCPVCGSAVFCGGTLCPSKILPLPPDQVPQTLEQFVSVAYIAVAGVSAGAYGIGF